jgi:hypothetical protein
VNQQVEEQIVELVQNDPQQAEFLATFWTVAMLALALAKRIWLQLKNKLAANRLYGSIKVLLDTVESFFEEMTPEQAPVWAAV